MICLILKTNYDALPYVYSIPFENLDELEQEISKIGTKITTNTITVVNDSFKKRVVNAIIRQDNKVKLDKSLIKRVQWEPIELTDKQKWMMLNLVAFGKTNASSKNSLYNSSLEAAILFAAGYIKFSKTIINKDGTVRNMKPILFTEKGWKEYEEIKKNFCPNFEQELKNDLCKFLKFSWYPFQYFESIGHIELIIKGKVNELNIDLLKCVVCSEKTVAGCNIIPLIQRAPKSLLTPFLASGNKEVCEAAKKRLKVS